MAETTLGEAVSGAANIEGVEGSVQDPLATLTDEQRAAMLREIRSAYTEGYISGERYGRQIGGQEALQAATTLSTMMADRNWQRAIETLQYFMRPIEAAS